ncbi:MAG: hypothetical protein WBQ75_05465 [Acetobacteraceae bacterium]
MTPHQHPADAVSERRQWDRLMAMARIGTITGDGVNRARTPMSRRISSKVCG